MSIDRDQIVYDGTTRKEAEEILRIVTECGETAYNTVIAQQKNWAVLLHLSHIRANIAQWLPIRKEDTVLEIGSGYGELSGMLSQKAKEVTAIESSKAACRVNAVRNGKYENLHLIESEFSHAEETLAEQYDWILLIGAFENAGRIVGGATPQEDLLRLIKRHLAPGGKVVVTARNRLGLQYFAGCQEESDGGYFKSIEGYTQDAPIRAFSRPELQKICQAAGYEQADFYYPYPDSRFPMTIYSDERLPKVGELWDNRRNFDRERYVMFDETRAYDQILQDGLFPIFSNAYLVILQEKQGEPQDKTVFAKFSNERGRAFAIRTDIRQDASGTLHAWKSACESAGEEHVKKLGHWYEELSRVYEGSGIELNRCRRCENETEVAFLSGTTLEEELDQLLLAGKKQEAVEKLMRYIEAVRAAGSAKQFEMTEAFEQVFGEVCLPTDLRCAPVTDIDMVAGNEIVHGDGWIHMDYEWTFDFPIPVNYVIYRIIQNYLYGNVDRSALKKELLYKKAGLTEQETAQYQKMEEAFQHYITGEHIPLRYLYEEISPGCIDFAAEERHRRELAAQMARTNTGIDVFIDTFEIAMTGIHIWGWAVSKADRQVEFALLDEQGNKMEPVHTERLYRRDVVDRFKLSGKNAKAGFHLEFALPKDAKRQKRFTLLSHDGVSEHAFPIPVGRLRIKQSRFGKKIMDLRGAKDTISYIAPHEMGILGESCEYRVENQRIDTWRLSQRLTEKELQQQRAEQPGSEPLSLSVLLMGDGRETSKTQRSLRSLKQQTRAVKEILETTQTDLAEAAAKAKGDWLLLLTPGDTLEPNFCYEFDKKLKGHEQAILCYCDSDRADWEKKQYFDPQFKPDFGKYTLFSGNYIGRSFLIRKATYEIIGGFRETYGSQEFYDLLLRAGEQQGEILHISKLLYHEAEPMERDLAQRKQLAAEWDLGRRVLEDYFSERQIPAQVTWANYPLRYRVKWTTQGEPLVSVIIPNQDHIRDLNQCLTSIAERSTYQNIEILVVENNSIEKQTEEYYKEMVTRFPQVRLLRWDDVFNYSAINNFAARQAKGEYLLFLNNDTEVLTPDWIEEMLSVCQKPDVGVTGAKLYYPDGTLQHAGVILGLSNIAGHLFVKEPGDISGYMGRACTMQNLSAVTAACMMTRTSVFWEAGGFDEVLQVALNDVDYCLKVLKTGRQVVWLPDAELFHYESKSRGLEDTPQKKARYDSEVAHFRSKWEKLLQQGDPCYNVNLSRTTWNCTFRIPPKK